MNVCINVNIRKNCWSIQQLCDNWQRTVDTRPTTTYRLLSSFWWSLVSAFSTIIDQRSFNLCFDRAVSFSCCTRRVEWVGIIALWGGGGSGVKWSRESASEVRTRPIKKFSRPRASNLFTDDGHGKAKSVAVSFNFFDQNANAKSNAKCNAIFVTRYTEM